MNCNKCHKNIIVYQTEKLCAPCFRADHNKPRKSPEKIGNGVPKYTCYICKEEFLEPVCNWLVDVESFNTKLKNHEPTPPLVPDPELQKFWDESLGGICGVCAAKHGLSKEVNVKEKGD